MPRLESGPDLAGKVAVVTGASRGLGSRAAIRLAECGARLMLVARGERGLAETASVIESAGGQATTYRADLSDPSSIGGLAAATLERLGQPAILMNAAGTFGPIQFIRDSDPAAWTDTLMINTVSAYLTCRAFVGGMIDSGWGRIVNVGSAASLHEPGPLSSAYATSKVALNRFTRQLAAELVGSGVTANVIHPGEVKTEMWAYIRDTVRDAGPEADRYREWATMVEETGGDDPDKAADLVLGLMGEDSASVTGRFLWIEGGLQAPIPSWDDPPGR